MKLLDKMKKLFGFSIKEESKTINNKGSLNKSPVYPVKPNHTSFSSTRMNSAGSYQSRHSDDNSLINTVAVASLFDTDSCISRSHTSSYDDSSYSSCDSSSSSYSDHSCSSSSSYD